MKSIFQELASKRRAELAMFESISAAITVKPVENAPVIDPVVVPVIDQEQAMFESIENNALANTRSMGMAAVIAWSQYGEPTADDFDMTAQAMADVDEDGEITDEETEFYNETLFAMVQALQYCGVSPADTELLVSGDDKAASLAYVTISEKLENLGEDKDEDELIAEFAVQETGMMEAKKKVIRNGETKWVNKPLKKRRLNAAQKAALKKARLKANSASARAKRKKSMRKRQSAGM